MEEKKPTEKKPIIKHRFSIRMEHELYEDLRALAAADDNRELATYVVIQLRKLVAQMKTVAPIKRLDPEPADKLFGPDSV